MLVFAPFGFKCDVSYAIALLCVGMFFNGAISSGHFSSYVDLAPNFAGTLMGISNTFGSKIIWCLNRGVDSGWVVCTVCSSQFDMK